jgi:L,D-peptidoglycan transpeptidase YkuD (ErfK/YbiS/YcfS/YnhG family)
LCGKPVPALCNRARRKAAETARGGRNYAARRRNYNRPDKLPVPRGHEGLWRRDWLYDIVVVLGYNDRPRSLGRGSAIFMHLARPGYKPTAGCIALSRGDMLKVLALLRPGDKVVVT